MVGILALELVFFFLFGRPCGHHVLTLSIVGLSGLLLMDIRTQAHLSHCTAVQDTQPITTYVS